MSQWVLPIVVTGGIVLLLVLAVFLVNREDSSSVASAAETAMVADNALGVVTAIRTGSTYAYGYLTVADSDGQADDLLADIGAASDELRSRVDRLASNVSFLALSDRTEDFLQVTDEFALVAGNDLSKAQTLLGEQAEAMTALVDVLVQVRDENVQSVLLAGEDVGRAAQAVRFLMLFVIPLAVIASIWRIQRRMSERKLLATEVEKQRFIADSKDAFVADVSHELRTPLTGIYGFAVALEENSTNLNEFQSEMVGLIINESVELSRMVDDLVALGRIDAGAVTYVIEDVDVAEEIEQVITPFRRLGISFEHDAHGLMVEADAARFRQILRNLLSNAVRYGLGEIAVSAYRGGEMAIVEVIDDGPGVPEEVADRLFERYVHTGGTAVVEGSVGLGLAIASSFAEGMGGDLSYFREDGLTVFRLALPRSSATTSLSAPIAAEAVS